MPKKRPTIDIKKEARLFDRTEPQAPIPDESDPMKVTGVGLRLSEQNELAQIAKELGVTHHALLQYAVRDFMRRWKAGERPKTRSKTVLDL
jgi:hypothetical protein